MIKADQTRELALDILMEILERGGLSHLVLKQALDKYRYLDRQDRAFITRVTEGTLEYRIQIDYIIDRFSSTLTGRMKPFVRTLLRMSVYQIIYMDRIPDSAVCNEAVKLAEKRHFGGLKGFVNGVLRKIAREKEQICFQDDSVRYSMPEWLMDLLREDYGNENAGKIAAAFLQERPLSVRCCMDRTGRGEIIAALQEDGAAVEASDYAEDILFLSHIDDLERLRAFRDGLITVQDLSSACAAKAAGIRAGDVILDVCGAPGGKALHAASLLRLAEAGRAGEIAAEKAEISGAGEAAAEEAEISQAGEAAEEAEAGRAGEAAEEKAEITRAGTAAEEAETGRAGEAAAASGKPEAALSGSRPRGHVYVRDISARKTGLIRENVVRCGYEDTVTIEVWDALTPDERMLEKADVVLADLPCSGLGVIGRKPDIKDRVKPKDIETLAALQREILSVVWQYVKPGGVLVYSTCTLTKQENIRNMEWFLRHYPFRPSDIRGRLGGGIAADSLAEGYIQLLPGIWPCDGFFLAVMQRA